MSGNYADAYPIKIDIGVGGTAIINGNVDVYIGSRIGTNFFKVVGMQTIVHAVPTTASQTVALQLSNAAGDFTTPTVLVTHTLTSGDAVGALQYTAVAAASTDVLETPQKIRIRHNAASTDATARYSVFVFVTPLDR